MNYHVILVYWNGRVAKLPSGRSRPKSNRYELRINKQRVLAYCPIGTPYNDVKAACEQWFADNKPT